MQIRKFPALKICPPLLESCALKFCPPSWCINDVYIFQGMMFVSGHCNHESFIGKSWQCKVGINCGGFILKYIRRASGGQKKLRYIFVAPGWPSNVCALKFCPLLKTCTEFLPPLYACTEFYAPPICTASATLNNDRMSWKCLCLVFGKNYKRHLWQHIDFPIMLKRATTHSYVDHPSIRGRPLMIWGWGRRKSRKKKL